MQFWKIKFLPSKITKLQANNQLQLCLKEYLIMGVRSIKSQNATIDNNSPLFLYPNMVKLITKTKLESDYQLLETIGRGTFGEVYRAKCLKTKRIRAVKKVDKKRNPKIQTLLLNQFDILKGMDHPNILKMYGLYEEFSNFSIVTQLCQGKQLFEVISKKKTFHEKDAASIFQQLCSAVKYLHNNKVMHRDLKPENVIYDEKQNTLKLVDFGSALRFQDSQIQQRRRIGTSYYIAPEVLSRCYNQKCDVWSAGVILYIMLCGQPPFKGANDDQILKKIIKGQLQFQKAIWQQISDEAKDLIRKMLEKDINKRLSMQKVMSHQWLEKELKLKTTSGNKTLQVEQKNLVQCLNNMKLFESMAHTNSIQQGVLIFIVNFVRNNQDQAQLMKCFQAIDLDGDGVLSLAQLQIAIAKYMKVSQKQALVFAKKIFQKADKNKSGSIDYSQFLVSAVNIEVAVSQENLDMAFDHMDCDHSGTLSVAELRQKLGENVSEEKYAILIKQFDSDKDGEISRNQFKGMMKKILKKDKN